MREVIESPAMLITSPIESGHQQTVVEGQQTVFFDPSNDVGYADTVALILALLAGFAMPRWRDGLVLCALIVVAVFALLLGLPIIFSAEPFNSAALGYPIFWITVALAYARILLVFTFAYSLRNLIDVGLRVVRRHFRH